MSDTVETKIEEAINKALDEGKLPKTVHISPELWTRLLEENKLANRGKHGQPNDVALATSALPARPIDIYVNHELEEDEVEVS